MADPLDFVPLAVAAADGSIDDIPCRRLVAGGLTLLQRVAPLVRALHGRRSAVLLPTSSHFIVALAASSGRSALLLDPRATADELDRLLADAGVGAVFTLRALAATLPAQMPRVLLDEAPMWATWRDGEATRVVDLSSHDGFHLMGDTEAEGAEEEALLLAVDPRGRSPHDGAATHRTLLRHARGLARNARLARRDHTLVLASPPASVDLVAALLAPLLAGGRVSTRRDAPVGEIIELLEHGGVSMLVATDADYTDIADALRGRGRPLDAPVLQLCAATDAPGDDDASRRAQDVAARWRTMTGQPLLSLASLVSPASSAPGRTPPGSRADPGA